jgi:hypothetical protein
MDDRVDSLFDESEDNTDTEILSNASDNDTDGKAWLSDDDG